MPGKKKKRRKNKAIGTVDWSKLLLHALKLVPLSISKVDLYISTPIKKRKKK